MQRIDGQFTIALTDDEAAAILQSTRSNPRDALLRMLVDQLQGGGRRVTLNDRQFGQLVGYMVETGCTEDGLRRAFLRPMRELFGAGEGLAKVSCRN